MNPTAYMRRAQFLDRDNYYIQAQPDFAPHAFLDELREARDPAGETGFIVLDYRHALGTDYPATTPLMLARYVRLRPRARLSSRLAASAEVYCVLAGAGETRNGADRIEWAAGDVFCLPGGGDTVHSAGDVPCLLWSVTNEPLFAFEGAAPRPGARLLEPVHYRAAEIAENLARTQEIEARKGTASNGNGAFILSSTGNVERRRLPFASLMLAVNSLVPGNAQRPHRHNAVALTLVLEAERCHSMIGGVRCEWVEQAALITPPAQVHSHHNEGSRLARVLIAQDSGLHYYCRTAGFSYGV